MATLFWSSKMLSYPATKDIAEAERMEHNIKPNNPLEAYMVKPTHIHKHLATLYMLTVELNLRTIVELGTRKGGFAMELIKAAEQIGGRVYCMDVSQCLEAKSRI